MKTVLKQIPNVITSLGILSGAISIVFAIDGHLTWAAIFIFAAAAFDFLDGFAARLLHAYSEIGKQLDSLADVISFGLAPAMILFTLLEYSMFGKNTLIFEVSAKWYAWIILFSAFLLPVFGALRLAKFNTKQQSDNYFEGLPIPAVGIFWASMGLFVEFSANVDAVQLIFTTKNLVIMAVFCAGLMNISLPMFSLKFKSLKWSENWYRFVYLLSSLIMIYFFSSAGIGLAILFYILLNISFYVFKVKLKA